MSVVEYPKLDNDMVLEVLRVIELEQQECSKAMVKALTLYRDENSGPGARYACLQRYLTARKSFNEFQVVKVDVLKDIT